MSALERIAAELDRMAEVLTEPDGAIDPFDLRHIARKLRAQADMIEKGLNQ